MNMQAPLTVFEDAPALGRALAAEIADGLAAAAAQERRYVLGCPGGRSPRTTYEALARLVGERALDLGGLVIAMMDDYVRAVPGGFEAVDPDAHYSCRRFAREEIAAPLSAAAIAAGARGIPPEHVWMPDPADPAAYDGRLRDAGGIDLFILASGATDGHVAFLPPGTAADSRTAVLALADSTRRDNLATFPAFGGRLEDVPAHGVTVGIATISELSRRAVMVIHGPDKREAVERVTRASAYDPAWPATVVASCRDAAVYADRAAAGEGAQEEAVAHG